MNPEDAVLCLCARQKFEMGHAERVLEICRAQPIRWESVLATAEQHQIAPLVGVNLSRIANGALQIPPAILNRFKQAQIHNVFDPFSARGVHASSVIGHHHLEPDVGILEIDDNHMHSAIVLSAVPDTLVCSFTVRRWDIDQVDPVKWNWRPDERREQQSETELNDQGLWENQ